MSGNLTRSPDPFAPDRPYEHTAYAGETTSHWLFMDYHLDRANKQGKLSSGSKDTPVFIPCFVGRPRAWRR